MSFRTWPGAWHRDVASSAVLRGLDEAGQQVVEGRAEALDGVPGSRQHGPLGAEPLLEHVAARLERGAVRARDNELRERRAREDVERDDRLGGRALDHQRPRALEE